MNELTIYIESTYKLNFLIIHSMEREDCELY